MMQKQTWWIAAVAALAVVLTGLAPAIAQDAGNLIGNRQRVMKTNGAHLGAIGDMLKGKVPFSAEAVALNAQSLSTNARLIPIVFQSEVTDGRTDAKARIWANWSDFKAKGGKLVREAAKLAEVAKSGDKSAIGAQVKVVGGSCGGCHKEYRKPKKESYKNRK